MEGLTSLQADFDSEIKRRNVIIRNISQQNDNLTKEIADKRIEISALDAEIDSKKKELDGIDDVFASKMEEFQAHVEASSKSLNDKDDELTKQKTVQAAKDSDQSKKELELVGRENNIEYMKEGAIKLLSDMLNETNNSIKEAIEDIKSI